MESAGRSRDADRVGKRMHEYAKGPLPLEVRRLERVLPTAGGSLETRRLLWSSRLLERIGTPEARTLPRLMAEGESTSPVTRQARTARARRKAAER